MTTPINTAPGTLGIQSFLAGGTVEFIDYQTVDSIVGILFSTPRAGVLHIYRMDGVNEILCYTETFDATAEEHEVRFRGYGFPHRFRFTNTDLIAGNISAYGT